MKDVRFYLEYATPTEKNKATRKKPGNHEGNVFAAEVFYSEGVAKYEGLGAVYFRPNSPVVGTSATMEYLSSHCLRISEAQAREIHPELFKRLDSEGEG